MNFYRVIEEFKQYYNYSIKNPNRIFTSQLGDLIDKPIAVMVQGFVMRFLIFIGAVMGWQALGIITIGVMFALIGQCIMFELAIALTTTFGKQKLHRWLIYWSYSTVYTVITLAFGNPVIVPVFYLMCLFVEFFALKEKELENEQA